MEVIYSGLLPTPEQVAQMAVDEDVDVVALSLLNGAHMTAFPKVVRFLKEKGGKDIVVVGGGIIPDADKPKLEKLGIIGNFGPGTSLKTIVDFIKNAVEEKEREASGDNDNKKSKKPTKKSAAAERPKKKTTTTAKSRRRRKK